VAWAEIAFAHAYHGLGDLRQALEHAQECLNIVEKTGEDRLAALGHTKRAEILADLGEFEAALLEVGWVNRHAQETGQDQTLMWAYRAEMHIMMVQERWQEMRAYIAAAPEKIAPLHIGHDLMACLALDLPEDVERLVPQILPENDPTQEEENSPWYLLLLARLHAYRGERERAARHFDLAVGCFEERHMRLGLGLALSWWAHFRRASGDLVGARQDAQRAVELLAGCAARPHLQRAQKIINSLDE
jgi:tetratricopeptide (TPR) repeat protein